MECFLIGIIDYIIWISEVCVIWIWNVFVFMFAIELNLQDYNDINMQSYAELVDDNILIEQSQS